MGMGARKRIARKKLRVTWTSLLAWAREFLPHYFSEAPAPFHAELAAALEDDEKRLIARVAPRGHAKSTCAALAFPLWCICEQRRRNIVIISYERSLAVQFARDIREELEGNDHIRAEYGDMWAAPAGGSKRKSRGKWSEAKFTTASGITVHALGSGAGIRGTRAGPHRPDLIICDDIETDDLVRSPRRRAKLDAWLRRVVMPALAPHGRLVVVGSLIHHDSLLANLRDPRRFPGWDYAVFRAIEAMPRDDGTFDLTPLWPARWSIERLHAERKRIGALAFEQEYMANPVDDARRVFRPEWLRRYEPRELIGRELLTFIAVDPATGVKGGDFFAMWVGSLDPRSGVIYTRELTLERIDIVAQIKRVTAAAERWRPLRIGVESTAYQVALKHMLDEYNRRSGSYIPIVELHPIANKRARIEGVAPLFEAGLFRLPLDLDSEIEAQFLQFPAGGHDDAPDVCAMGIELARSLRSIGTVDACGVVLGDRSGCEW